VPVEQLTSVIIGPHTGVMSVGCSLAGWSAVASAPANATLAAVLAGFMINGMILVLSRKPAAMTAGYVQAVSLLFAAFFALGLDAYLFGLVTGDSTQIIDNVSACRRTWTEAMFAAGLLGIGAVAIIVGFVILFDTYLSSVRQDGQDLRKQDSHEQVLARKASLQMLQTLCNVLRRVVAFIVVALLWVTAKSYLLAVFNDRIPTLGKKFIYVYGWLGVLALVVVIGFAVGGRTVGFQSIKALQIAIYSSVFYTVASVGLAGFTASLSIHDWGPTNPVARVMISVAVVWVLVASLIPLLLLLGCSVPTFASSQNPEPRSSAATLN
jgi:hypothetical protein